MIKTNYTRDDIERKLNICIDTLYERDLCLLTNDVNERTITHKLAEYLQWCIPTLNVDCEYNRNFEAGERKPKSIYLLEEEARKSIYEDTARSANPDIIVHRRLKNDENLLIIEVKKSTSREDYDFDRRKLIAFTEPRGKNPYSYKYGVFLEFETGVPKPSKPIPLWFCEGENCE